MAKTRLQGYVEEGNGSAVTNLSGSSIGVERAFPLATVTIYLTGTLTLATIYSDASGTSKVNPFTADTNAYWFAYLDLGTYDITFSGGGIAIPFTLSSVTVGSAFSNDVSRMATGGLGTLISPWTGWEGTFNALPANSRIHFPAGSYTQASMITVKDRWKISGDGRGATVITSAMAGTAFRINTVPSPALGYVSIRDLSIVNTNAANTGSGILVVGASYSDISDVRITGFRYGVAMLNAEIFDTSRVTLEFQTRACLWIVNNSDYNLTYADIDYSTYAGGGTNAITFYGCEFNGAGGTATPVLVIDDGGYAHNWYGGNFNGGNMAMRFAGVSQALVTGADFELQSATGDVIVMATLTYNSAAGVGGNSEITFSQNMMTPNPVKAVFDASYAESLILIGNRFNTPIAAVKNSSGCNLFNLRSVMNNGPLYSGTPASYFDLASNNSANALNTSLPLVTSSYLSSAALRASNSVAATTPGAVVKKLPVYDAAGALLGYVPIYSSIT